MLELDSLQVRYGRVPAVHDLSLVVEQGHAVGLIGPNGAGKTTALRTIMGLVAPAAGKIEFEGESLLGLPPEQITRRGIALVPEGRQIFGTLSVEENLRIGATVRRDRDAVDGDIQRALDRFPVLAGYFKSSAAKLSGGEQQQLAIARALLSNPRLLLLDEPSLGLAPMVVDLVFQTLEELRREGVTILLVEQNAMRTLEFADYTYVLSSGSIVTQGRREELAEAEDFASSYLGGR
jgi:branched-chain amino acid transport system ATP-binding protein